ncbi:Dolichyl-phosphate-mannose-protein mannosyltransferase [Abditibacterium utsteinense]|uniref:Dolichyl-phosphate-mannose-protein mannosyltransferase n=1 Tax=Abditibacterium utsteinense TaxID=1960156 RepID=A0A2S8SUY5_9BACT|nr:phospholipid carrier-dependent glycosyltransferase [Abditibacterium utsteinense]PQV64589.1 Dolichyl-phosphate-mannose-protein mannosyltransferase [Abditibacterium utsteinense]
MNYLPDAILFLVLTLCLAMAGWCCAGRSRSSFEAAFVPGAAILGAYAWLIWIVGSLWKLVPLFWCVLPWPLLALLIFKKRENLTFHARNALRSVRALRGVEAALAFYLVALFALTFFLSLAPPNGADYDSLTYHLAAPAQYLRLGKVAELPYDHHSYFPFTLEMLYAVGLWARGAVFAKLFHWLMLPIGALALYALGKRAASARSGLLAAALFASMPMILQEATTAYIDLGFAAFAFLATLCFAGAITGKNPREQTRDLALSGAFCGFCLGSKYFGVLIFGFLGISLLVFAWKAQREAFRPDSAKNESSRLALARSLSFFVVPALVLGGVWYGRNIFWTGNPFFPFAYGIFGGRGWTSEMARDYDVSQSFFGFGKTPLDLAWLPWRLALSPLNVGAFGGKLTGQPFWPLSATPVENGHYGFFDVPILDVVFTIFPGPAIFALGLPALFAAKKPRIIALCAAFFGFLFVFWALTSQQIRYLIPALGFLAVVGGWGAARITQSNTEDNAPRFRIAKIIGALGLTLWLVFSPALIVWRARANFAVLSGARTPTDYLRRSFSGFAAMDYANQNTPKDAKFAVYGEPRCFYLDRNYFWADDPHNNLINYAALKNGAALARALSALGATHVLWNTQAGQNGGVFAPPQPLMDEAIEAGNLIFVVDVRGYRIYRIAAA